MSIANQPNNESHSSGGATRNMNPKTAQAFSLIELFVVVCLIAMVAAVMLPALSHTKSKSVRIACVSNQKQIGVAYRVWSGDNGDNYPAQIPNTNTNSGWADFVKMTNAGRYCWSNYCVIQNELGQSPMVLVCPADNRRPAKDFKNLSNKNVSYFMGPGASENLPLSLLGGDRNLAPGLNPQNDFGFSPEDGKGNDVILQTNSPICWFLKMRSADNVVGAGNLLLGDGSVQQCSSARLMTDYQMNAVDAGNYSAGYVNKSNSFRLVFP